MTDYNRGDAYEAGLWNYRNIEAFVADGNSVNSDELEKLREQIAVLEASNRIKQENLDRLQSIIDEANSQEPVAAQFKSGSFWKNFENEAHEKNTREAGYIVRDLYAKPIPAQPINDLLCELYQVLGALDADEKVLNQVSAAIHGDPLPHDTLLPYLVEQPSEPVQDGLKVEYPKRRRIAVPVPEPTEIDVYRWFQESTINHHIEEDGGHISKRAMFLAKKAIEFACNKKPRITEEDAREIAESLIIEPDSELKSIYISGWLDETGRALLEKLNERKV